MEDNSEMMPQKYSLDEQLQERDVMIFFPRIFTMVSITLFILPGYLAFRTDSDPVVLYWKGGNVFADWFLFLIPVIIAAAHIFHVYYGPSKYVTTAAAFFPSLILTVYGITMMSLNPADSLFSIDCNTMPGKSHLQLEWEAAHSLYKTCLNQTAMANHKFTVDTLTENFRIQDCTEYPKALAKHRETWTYLRHLEERTHCTGFCTPGQALWTSPSMPHKDSCAVAVASAFEYMAVPHSFQVFILSMATVVLVGTVMVILVPLMTSYGLM